MSKIDLDRLVVRQTYFLPIAEPSQIKTVILNKLISTEPKLLQRIVPWQISREQECSCDFTFMFMYEYILEETIGIDSTESKKFKSLANKKMKEYTRKMPESYFKTLSSIRSGTPIEIHLIITKKEENGCLCKIECLPALYRKLVQLDNMEVSDFEIRDSYLSCKRFIESIFEGGLSATLVTEEKKGNL